MIPKIYKEKANKSSHWLKRESSTQENIQLIKKYLNIKKPKTLDIGCAEGENTHILNQSGFNVIGIDYDKKLLNLAKKSFPKIKFEFGNLEKLNFKPNTFDLVYCINTLFYTDLSKSIPELLNITKKNGLIFVTFDIKIIDLDKNKVIHKDSLKNLKSLIGNEEIVYIKKRQRTDNTPFKHRHDYYDVLIKKTRNQTI